MFDDAADVKGPGGAAVELHCSFHVCVKRFDHALQFWWAANLWKDLEETVSADKIKRLCPVNESDIGASVVLFIPPGVGEGRRPCLLLTFQLESRTVIQDRHVLPASAVGSI